MQDLKALKKKFGSVTHKGIEYILDGHAHLSNRVFDGGWQDAREGEAYTAEYKATAINKNTRENAEVYWQFAEVKGNEPEDESNYPFDNRHIYRVLIQ